MQAVQVRGKISVHSVRGGWGKISEQRHLEAILKRQENTLNFLPLCQYTIVQYTIAIFLRNLEL